MPADKSLEHTIAAIEALDLEPIKFKATRAEDGYGWTPEYAERMAQSYRRYLLLVAKYPEATLAPDQDTDRFWHLHILDTRKYAADCEAVFGEFLHHFPYLGLRGEDDAKALDEAFAQMQALMIREFGTPADVDDAAFCTVDTKAAFCTVDAKAAFCTVDTKAKAAARPAFCTVDTQAAFCTTHAKPAFCTVDTKTAATARPAFCTVDTKTAPAAKAAFCTVDARAAFCTVDRRKDTPQQA